MMLKIQFDSDKPKDVLEVEANKPFSLSLLKTDVEVGNGLNVKQESNIITFTDGKKEFKIWIE